MSNISAEFTYVTLWTAFRHLTRMYHQAYPDTQRKDEALALRLAALNMGFFSFEAFLNHLIQAIRPEVWKDERGCFSGRRPVDGTKYYGPIGKLKFVHLLCGRTYDENADDVKTAVKIKGLRDVMAHGRSYYDEPDDIPASEMPNVPPSTSKLFDIATHDLLIAALQHLDGLRCSLFDETKQRFQDVDLGSHPRLSISGMRVVSVVP